jgi:type VI secretion system protein ImpB
MSSESSQKWFERNRPPRVQISYDVETGGAIQKKELPLVIGVLSDLSGMTAAEGAERRFIDIERDNFNGVLEKIGPTIDVGRLGLRGEGLPAMSGTLAFKSMDDFSPDAVVKQVTGLAELFETRRQLRDLMAKLDGNAALEAQLTRIFFDGGQPVSDAERNTQLDALLGRADAQAGARTDDNAAGKTNDKTDAKTIDPAPAPAPVVDPNPPAAS